MQTVFAQIIFAFLMMLAFLIDQIQEATCGLFKEGLKYNKTKRALWEKLKNRFYSYYIKSWNDLFIALGPNFKGAVLSFNTS